MGVENIKKVYLLYHIRESGMDEDSKLIGVFSSKEEALGVQLRYQQLPGFEDYPDGFLIDEHVVGKAAWAEGFG